MVKQVGPAQAKPITRVALRGRFRRLAGPCAASIMARSTRVLQRKRPKIRLQSDPSHAVDPRPPLARATLPVAAERPPPAASPAPPRESAHDHGSTAITTAATASCADATARSYGAQGASSWHHRHRPRRASCEPERAFPPVVRPSAERHLWRPPEGGALCQGLRPWTPGSAERGSAGAQRRGAPLDGGVQIRFPVSPALSCSSRPGAFRARRRGA
jgi:hypothetical protein